MNTLIQDTRYAFRMIARKPGFALMIIVTLALGIGANTAMFSIVEGALLRSLPYDQPERLVRLMGTMDSVMEPNGSFAYPVLEDFRQQCRTLVRLGSFVGTQQTLLRKDGPERVEGARVSSDFFKLLGVRPELGRIFTEDEDRMGSQAVALLSHGFWLRRFGGDGGVVGRTIVLDGDEVTVVGVMPKSFSFPIEIADAEVWTSLSLAGNLLSNRGMGIVESIARLRPEYSMAQAQAELNTIVHRSEATRTNENRQRGVGLVALHEHIAGGMRQPLLLLQGAVGMVLMIACANVAGLLLTHGMERRRELAIRVALGANRARLVRQLITENVLLSLISGVLGVVGAFWCLDSLTLVMPVEVQQLPLVELNTTVLFMALATSVGVGVVFGLVPAFPATCGNPERALRDTARSISGHRQRRLRSALVSGQIAIAMVLVVAMGLLARSFVNLVNVSPGFTANNILTFQMSVPFSGYDTDRRAGMYREVLERLSALPGVEATGACLSLPFASRRVSLGLKIDGRTTSPETQPSIRYSAVSANYFHTLGIPLVRGRYLDEHDRRGRPGAIIINQALADRYWPNEDPTGKYVKPSVGFGDEDEPSTFEIVGVVASIHDSGLDVKFEPQMYVSYLQHT